MYYQFQFRFKSLSVQLLNHEIAISLSIWIASQPFIINVKVIKLTVLESLSIFYSVSTKLTEFLLVFYNLFVVCSITLNCIIICPCQERSTTVRNRMSVLNASIFVSLTEHHCQTYRWCTFHVRLTVKRSDDVTV